ncbi:MAG: flagellar assembly protein FliW [Peptococcaceae bacterium]|nr:flagellar assembly protein FliW [Peptococcaceae bacterium]
MGGPATERVPENTEKSGSHPGLVVSFPWGMPGLDCREYILSPVAPESPFYFLQSAEQPGVGLILINPFAVFSDYEFELEEDSAGRLKLTDPEKAAVFCTVNASRGMESATVNLMAPIVINMENLVGKQVVLNDKRYSLRTPLAIMRKKK